MDNYSLADIKAATDGGDGFFGGNGIGFVVLIFLFLLGFSGNGLFGNGGNALTQAELQNGLYNQTTDRNLSDIRAAQCADTMALNNSITTGNYNTLLGFKDMQAQMASCCCETQKTIIEQNQLTRDAINQLKIDELADKLALARNQVSNLEQSQYILNSLGRYVQNPACPYPTYCCTGTSNL